MLDLEALCTEYSVIPRGVIHIGAHEGQEIESYRAMGVQHLLLIEANPVVFERLQQNIAGLPNVRAVNYAICDRNSTVTLHITSLDLSSSILPLKYHQKIYPDIKEIGQVSVESKRLDTLLQELQIDPAEFNIINIDIQGAELLAFQGATNTLKYMDAINSEVSYKELYEGSALIDRVDEFLKLYGFDRVAVTTPYHPSWGDAFYVKPVITMSTLGKNGRFGNQIFQYAFLKIYAQQHHLRVQTSNWIGQYIFGHNDPAIAKQLPIVVDSSNNIEKSDIYSAKGTYKNIDFWGYFQYHTSYYAPHKDYFRSLFQPVPEVLKEMTVALENLRSKGKTIVGLHLRRGDFGHGPHFVTPSESYKKWLSSLWATLDEPVLFIASDEIEKVIIDFAEYNPISTKDLGINFPQANFYPDFYILSKCDIVAISNSSFSFAACMLNDTGKLFYRPQVDTQKLILFDPWNSKPVFENGSFIAITPELLSQPDSILKYVQKYEKEPTNPSSTGNVRQLRLQLADYLFGMSPKELQNAYLGEIGKTYQILRDSHIRDEILTDPEQIAVNNLVSYIDKGLKDPKAINCLLAAMLLCRADRLNLEDKIDSVPSWFLNEYLKFIFFSPLYFQEVGELDNYYHHIERWLDILYANLSNQNKPDFWQKVALFFVRNINLSPLKSTDKNLQDIYKKRGDIIELFLKLSGYKIDFDFGDRDAHRQKIRVGVLSYDFLPQKETFSTLPAFEYLDKQLYEIILYAVNFTGHPVEKYCQSRADRAVHLPKDLPSQVQTIRSDDLDILLIGTDITAATNPVTLLAVHRLARIQLTSVSSPVTTGIRNIDYYISGNLTEPIPDNQLQYTEKLVGINGSAHCFNYKVEPQMAKIKCQTKEDNGMEDAIVFVSGANFCKIIPELRETWAKIMAAVPKSILILYPFGSAAVKSYPGIPFLNKLRDIFANYGIDRSRLFILNPLPSRADLKECLKFGDIYLDSYPYSGASSIIDSLEAGLPTVVMDGKCFGNSLRSRQASALLRDLEIEDLIAENAESYIKLAINLARNVEFRQQKREQIRQKMQGNPRFLDSRFYSAQMGVLFQRLFQEWQKSNGQTPIDSTNETITNHLPERSVDSLEFLNLVSGCLNLYEIDAFDESVLTELRSLRKRLADFWLSAIPEELENFYLGNPGKAHQMFLASEFKQEILTESEQIFIDELIASLTQADRDRKAINYRLAATLYCENDRLGDSYPLPQW